MITKDKIEEAANENSYLILNFVQKEDPKTMFKNAFWDGVNWYKDELWHSMNEVPSHDGFILLKYNDKEKDCFGYGVLHTDTDLNLYLYDEDLKEEASDKWLNFCNNEAEAKFEWCYLCDLSL